MACIQLQYCKAYSINLKEAQVYIRLYTLTFNPESALDFVAKLNYSIKARIHGLFLKKEYFCILNLKIVREFLVLKKNFVVADF